jgi:hypothetical protein
MNAAQINAYTVCDYWNHKFEGPFRSYAVAEAALAAHRARHVGIDRNWFGIEAVTLPARDALGNFIEVST